MCLGHLRAELFANGLPHNGVAHLLNEADSFIWELKTESKVIRCAIIPIGTQTGVDCTPGIDWSTSANTQARVLRAFVRVQAVATRSTYIKRCPNCISVDYAIGRLRL